MCFGCQKSGDAITFVREIEHLDFVGAVEWLAGRSRHHPPLHRRRRGRVPAASASGSTRPWSGRRLVPRPPAHRPRRRRGPRLPAQPGLRRRDRAPLPARLGAVRVGRAGEGRCACPTTCSSPPGSASRTATASPPTPSGAGCCSRSSTPRARPSPSAGASSPATTGPSTRTRRRPSSTASPACSTASTGTSPTIVGHGAAGEVIVCEGYTDVIGFARAGIPRAVATCGTALTEDHVKLLARFAKRIVLAFDADAAGQGAADKLRRLGEPLRARGLRRRPPARRRPRRPGPARPRRGCGRRSTASPSGARARSAPSRTSPSASTACSPPPTSRSVEGRARAATAGVDVLARPPQRAGARCLPHEAGRLLPGRRRAAARQLQRAQPSPPVPAAGARRGAAVGARAGADGPPGRARGARAAGAPPRRDARRGWPTSCSSTTATSPCSGRWRPSPTSARALALAAATDPGAAEVLARVAVSDSDAEPADVGRPPPRARRRAAPRRAAGRGPGGRGPARARRSRSPASASPSRRLRDPATRRSRQRCWPRSACRDAERQRRPGDCYP